MSGNLLQNTNVVNNYGNLSQNGNAVNNNGDQNGQNGGGCSRSSYMNQKVTTGVVVQVRPDSFDIKANDGQIYSINVAPCTRLNANKPDFKLKNGHQAVVKGITNVSSLNEIQGDQITCLES